MAEIYAYVAVGSINARYMCHLVDAWDDLSFIPSFYSRWDLTVADLIFFIKPAVWFQFLLLSYRGTFPAL